MLRAFEERAEDGEDLDPRWRGVAVLGDDGYAQFGQAVLDRFEADDALAKLR